MSAQNHRTKVVLAALFLSGAAGLVHEVVWARMLALLIGSTAHAHAVVLAVFMGGLALGAVIFGRRSDRGGDPLRTYVLLEVAIAVYSLALPWIAEWAGQAYAALAASLSAEVRFGARLGLAMIVILTPAVWMGGTLPILARYLVEDLASTRRQVARLYSLNNLGAVLGSGVAGFVLLPAVGLRASIVAASALNLAAALLVGLARRGRSARAATVDVAAPSASEVGYGALQYRTTLVCLLLAGFAAMGYEVVFLRLIGMALGGSTYSFTVMLMAFITGIGIGSAVIARARVRDPLWWLALSQLAVVVVLVATTPLMARLPYWIGLARVALHDSPSGFELHQATKAGLCFALLLLPTACIGCAFPLVAQVQSRSVARVGQAVGSTYAWNTVGNVLGVLITALVLIPTLGTLGAFHVNLLLSGAAALALLGAARGVPRSKRLVAALAAVLAPVLYALGGTGWTDPILFARNHLRLRAGPGAELSADQRAAHPTASFASWRAKYVDPPEEWATWFQAEDANASIVVSSTPGSELTLYVNTKPDASTVGDLPTELLLGHMPMFLALDASSVFILGHGSGITAGAVLKHPIEHLDVLEISSSVLAADELFAEDNGGALSDPRVSVHQDDGRNFLRTASRAYDVIISEPSNPWVKGNAGMFTQGYFRTCRDSLAPGGVFLLWFHQSEQSDEAVQIILRTLLDTFPSVQVHHVLNGDAFAVASERPFELDFARMEERFERAEVRSDLARIGVLSLGTLLGHHVLPPERAAAVAGAGPLNTDDHERLEFMAPRAFFTGKGTGIIWEANAWEIGGTLNDCMLDAYVAWRDAAGDPYTRLEFEELGWVVVQRLLGEGLPKLDVVRMVESLRRRLQPSERPRRPGTSTARGGVPELDELEFEEAWFRASVYRDTLRENVARELYERALGLRPEHTRTRINLASLMAAGGEGDRAIELLEDALPGDRSLRLELASALVRAGRHDRAHALLAELREEEEDTATLLLSSRVFSAQGETARALSMLDQALRQEPANLEAALLAARLLAPDPAMRERALELVESSLRYHPDDPELRGLQQGLRR